MSKLQANTDFFQGSPRLNLKWTDQNNFLNLQIKNAPPQIKALLLIFINYNWAFIGYFNFWKILINIVIFHKKL